jgi:predicted MFS family arabinose efflux permease
VFVVLAVLVTLVAVRPLVPRGTLSARRGLPSVILLRGLVGAAFFGAEVYLPYLLIKEYAYSPALAGLALTVGALAWAAASWLQGRLTEQLSHPMSTTIGSTLVLVAIALALVTALFHLPAAIAIAGWVLGGGGMGLMYPRISVMTLAMSTTANQGFNSSALSISDSLGAALALATTGVVFVTLGFPGVFAFTAVIAVYSIVIAPRVAALRGRTS